MTRARGRWTARAILGCAMSLALCASAHAQDATRAHLLTVPDAQALSDHFPVVALARGVSGRAVLQCAVAVDGSSECSAAEETPANMGFGAAAAALAQDWRFSPRTENGAAVASMSRIPIEFQSPTDGPLVIERNLQVDGVRGVAPSMSAENDGVTLATRTILVCRWAGRGDCPILADPGQSSYQNTQYYPMSAHTANVDGRVLVACAIRSDRHADCSVEDESPGNYGFGEHAQRLTEEVITQGHELFQPGSVVRVPVEFVLSDNGEHRTPGRWVTRPTALDFNRYFPMPAMQQEVSGAVDLVCQIRADRKLDCVVSEERPAGYGFGSASLRISSRFTLSEDSLGLPGLAVNDRIHLPITFRIG